MSIDHLSFAVVMTIGLFTSLEDIRTGKIRNIWIAAGLLFISFLTIATEQADRRIFFYIISNAVLSFSVTYIFWKHKLWFAGDAKLFFLYALLLPMSVYRNAYIPFFPSLQLLVFSFLPAAFYLLILGLVDFFKDPDRAPIMSSRDARKFIIKFLGTSLSFTLMFLLNQVFWSRLQHHFITDQLSNRVFFLVMFFTYKPLDRFFDKHRKALYAAIGVALLAFTPYFMNNTALASRQFAKSLWACFLLLSLRELFRRITYEHIERSKDKTMPFAPWLFLGILLTWGINIAR